MDNENENIDLSKLNDKYESKVFKDVNFTEQKNIKQINLTNVDFFDCDFSNVLISGCEFKKCRFVRCKFNKARLLNVKFSCDPDDASHPTMISKCTFEGNTLWDVTIDKNCTFDQNDFIGEKFDLNNFWLRGEKIEDINKLISVVEVVEEQVQDPLTANNEVNKEIQVDEFGEREDRQDLETDYKLYNVLFPEVLKQYSALKKDDYGYGINVDNIEFSISPDNDSYAWRYVFLVRDTDDSLGSDVVTVDTTKEITFETLKEAFETMVKGEVKSITDRTNSDIVKNSLRTFVEVVFKVIIEDVNFSSTMFITSDNPADIVGDFNCGYDNESGELVTIIGQPFASDDTIMAQKMKELVKKFVNGTIRDDYMGGNYETSVQQTYSEQNCFSVYVIKQSPICVNAYLMPFNRDHVTVLKK